MTAAHNFDCKFRIRIKCDLMLLRSWRRFCSYCMPKIPDNIVNDRFRWLCCGTNLEEQGFLPAACTRTSLLTMVVRCRVIYCWKILESLKLVDKNRQL